MVLRRKHENSCSRNYTSIFFPCSVAASSFFPLYQRGFSAVFLLYSACIFRWRTFSDSLQSRLFLQRSCFFFVFFMLIFFFFSLLTTTTSLVFFFLFDVVAILPYFSYFASTVANVQSQKEKSGAVFALLTDFLTICCCSCLNGRKNGRQERKKERVVSTRGKRTSQTLCFTGTLLE